MENISKIVAAKSDGRRVGYILDVALTDSMQKAGYYVVDDDSEGEFLLLLDDIISASGDVVLIEDVNVLQFSAERSMAILGKEVIDEGGQDLGKVLQLDFQKRKCTKIITEKCEILAKFVQKIGKDVVFVSFKKKRPAPARPNPFAHSGDDVIVQIQNFQHSAEPERVRLSTSFYIGKVCTQDIFGYNNEKIALSGDVITRAVVEKAKRHNKLNQLFFAIKR